MERPNRDIGEALHLAERKVLRLERSLFAHRLAVAGCVLVIVAIILIGALGQRRHFARALLLDDEIVCVVATQSEAEQVRQRLVAAGKGELAGEAFIKQKWEDAPYEVDERPVLTVDEAVALLQDKVTVYVSAAGIEVDGVEVAALATEELAQKALDTLKSEYISEGTSNMLSQKLEPEATIVTVSEEPSRISTDIRDVVKKLTEAHNRPAKYQVKPGDFPEKIATAHGISVADLYSLNPDMKNRTIHPGEKIDVGVPVPAITVVTTYEVTVDEVIAAPVEKRPSDALAKGEKRVSSNGKPGRRSVTYRVTKRNDKEVSREVVEEKSIAKPQPKILLVGTRKAADT